MTPNYFGAQNMQLTDPTQDFGAGIGGGTAAAQGITQPPGGTRTGALTDPSGMTAAQAQQMLAGGQGTPAQMQQANAAYYGGVLPGSYQAADPSLQVYGQTKGQGAPMVRNAEGSSVGLPAFMTPQYVKNGVPYFGANADPSLSFDWNYWQSQLAGATPTNNLINNFGWDPSKTMGLAQQYGYSNLPDAMMQNPPAAVNAPGLPGGGVPGLPGVPAGGSNVTTDPSYYANLVQQAMKNGFNPTQVSPLANQQLQQFMTPRGGFSVPNQNFWGTVPPYTGPGVDPGAADFPNAYKAAQDPSSAFFANRVQVPGQPGNIVPIGLDGKPITGPGTFDTGGGTGAVAGTGGAAAGGGAGGIGVGTGAAGGTQAGAGGGGAATGGTGGTTQTPTDPGTGQTLPSGATTFNDPSNFDLNGFLQMLFGSGGGGQGATPFQPSAGQTTGPGPGTVFGAPPVGAGTDPGTGVNPFLSNPAVNGGVVGDFGPGGNVTSTPPPTTYGIPPPTGGLPLGASPAGATPDQALASQGSGVGYLNNIAQNAGYAADATPAWQAMIASQDRQNQTNAANLAEKYNVSGNRFSSAFGSGMSDYWSQIGASQNAQLTQATLQEQDAARQRELTASGQLGQQGYGAMSQLSSQNFQQSQLSQQQQLQAAMAMMGYGTQAAGQINQASAGATTSMNEAAIMAALGLNQNAFNATQQLNQNSASGANTMNQTEIQAAMAYVQQQLALQGMGMTGANNLSSAWNQNLQTGSQLGQQQYTAQNNQIQALYQLWQQTQPQYNPLISDAFAAAMGFPPVTYPQQQQGWLPQVLSAAGQLAGGIGAGVAGV